MNDVHVVILGGLNERGGNFKNDKGENVDYHIRSQDARLESGGFVYPYEVRLQDGQPAYAEGRYRLALERMVRCNNNKLTLDKFPKLDPVNEPAKRAA